MATKYFRTKTKLTMDEQRYFMSVSFPGFKCQKIKGGLSWVGSLQPTPISISYDVKIVYNREDYWPKAYVVEPKLKLRKGEAKIPHTYPGPRPCLFSPGVENIYDWFPSMSISKTIVHWLSLWLFYYEIWHCTGDWLGGGVHSVNKREDKPKEYLLEQSSDSQGFGD